MSESEKYEVLEKIGHGSFGIIRKVKRKTDGQVLCRKEINYIRMSQKEREQLHAEFSILSSLRHPNIVGYYHREHLKATQDLHLYMEYCGNGDLGRVIKDLQVKKQYAEEGFVWSMFSQLVTALYRCHYGADPPEVGSHVMGLWNAPKPRQPEGGVMILHRDLKPENVFLGEDNSVKLGDFGLSKIMKSHDFASTYVGTPFYMSPEICAAERYTLKSDIWSLGCIMYELCSREPPFNAKSHFQLVQKIKEGRVPALPSVYSPDLIGVIKDCLRVNPDKRPDTAHLLNLPIVKLMRKEKEVVELNRILKTKEELAAQRLQEAEEQMKRIEAERSRMRQDLDDTVRREWEVKARLEIDRQVQLEMERLQKVFDAEVQKRVEGEVSRQSNANSAAKGLNSSPIQNDIPLSSVSTSTDCDFPSTTDITELSIDSPEPTKVLKKSTRTPFGRAQTMFAGTPMDIEMGEPSPISIASLSLSPRRNGGIKAPGMGGNIFAAAGDARERWQPTLIASDTDDEDDVALPPSPTRQKSVKNPFKPAGARPQLVSQNTAPLPKLNSHSNIFAAAAAGKAQTAPTLPTLSSQPGLRPMPSINALRERPSSPNRRLSKIPSSTTMSLDASPQRKPSFNKKNSGHGNITITNTSASGDASSGADLNKFALKNTMALAQAQAQGQIPKPTNGAVLVMTSQAPPKGRTLVELAQARAGGRPIEMVMAATAMDGAACSPPKGKRFVDRMAQREKEQDVPTWDPERDEMPSPFLVRHKTGQGRAW